MERKATGIIPKIAKAMGQQSAKVCCILWLHQPKVPNEMKESAKK